MNEWHEALQKQQAMHSFWISEQGKNVFAAINHTIGRDVIPISIEQSTCGYPLRYGECFYWSRSMVDMVSIAAQSIPAHWTLMPSMLPSPNGFFWLGKVVDIQTPPEYREWLDEQTRAIVKRSLGLDGEALAKHIQDHPDDGISQTQALTWAHLSWDGNRYKFVTPPYDDFSPGPRDQIVVVFYQSPGIRGLPIPGPPHAFDIGMTLQEATEGWSLALNDMSLFAAMLTFLQQKIMMPVRQSPTRAMWRQAEREQRTLPPVNVIKLRHHVYRKTDEHSDVEWAWQWVVRGHWRDQWYPSIERHQPIWISPYMKGPEDKPLKETERIFAVIR